MKDQISIERLALLHPKVRKDFQDFIEECENVFNITIRIVQGLRTFAEQDDLYKIGRSVVGANASPQHPMGDIVTNSPAGTSWHNWGAAVDIVPIDGNTMDWKFNYAKIVNIAAQWDITWGGNFPGSFKDYDHFEEKCGYTIQQMLEKRANNDFIAGTSYVNL